MSQAPSLTLADQPRTQFRQNLNSIIAALASSHSGPTRPDGIGFGGLWVNTSVPSSTIWTLYLFDGSHDIALGTLNTTANVFNPAIPTGYIFEALLADLAVGTSKLKNSAVTYAKMQNVSATARVLGRVSAGSGVVEEIPIGSAPGNILRLNSSGQVPAVDGSLLTNLSNTPRAWVNFNGQSGVIRASFNVSSITRHGAGDYTINFSTALPDENYAFVCTVRNNPSHGSGGNANAVGHSNIAPTASALRIQSGPPSSGVNLDYSMINVIVVR